MEVPRYWAYVPLPYKVPTPVGSPVSEIKPQLIWRSSEVSVDDAQDKAEQALERWKEHVQNVGKPILSSSDLTPEQEDELMTRDEESSVKQKTSETLWDKEGIDSYPYAVSLREKVLEEINDSEGRTQAFLSRNGFGAVVLNVADVMFLDWDSRLPTLFEILTALGKWFLSFFQKDKRLMKFESKFHSLPPFDGIKELESVVNFVRENSDWSVRIYRTAAGYRGLVTHRLFDPASDEVLQLMEQLECDPMYVKLCRKQKSFRARLTPKGNRLGLWPDLLRRQFRFRYPWLPEDKNAAEEYDKAVEIYKQRQQNFTTCQYLGTLGCEFIHHRIVPILELHDHWTLAEQKTLA